MKRGISQSFERKHGPVSEALRLREQMADRVAFAIAVLSEASRGRSEDVVPFLESRKRDRAIATAVLPQGADPTSEINEVIRQVNAEYGDPRVLASAMAATLEPRLAQLLRHRAH